MRLRSRHSCGTCSWDAADIAPHSIRASELRGKVLTRERAHGSCEAAPTNLRWGVDSELASRIGCFNRRGAEPSGYFTHAAALLDEAENAEEIVFYDSVTSEALFVAPRNRTMAEFLDESRRHGWPSFRDEEVIIADVRVLRGSKGEVVSMSSGIHLGHNLPDARNRYCINLVSIAGRAPAA